MLEFLVTHTHRCARVGRLITPHGAAQTPLFMPVGTAGTVKGLLPGRLREAGVEMVLANTYHLQLRPSAEVVAELGGLHRFMAWDGPILTDSGGFQLFSLAEINRITDDGVTFRSHIDGAPLTLTPESAVDIQVKLGADVIMPLDQCPPLPSPPETIKAAVDRTLRWAGRCKEALLAAETAHGSQQTLFAIVQGGLDPAERFRCAQALVNTGFAGYAIGGLSVGESHAEMVAVLGPTVAALPADRPRYLMGVGMPRDILAAVRAGVDMFDCVLPTRNGRNSFAFTAAGSLRMRNQTHSRDDRPIEPGCDCLACARFSRGYIRHLFLAKEMLGAILTSLHNVRFYQRFMSRIRDRIWAGTLDAVEEEFPIARGDETDPALAEPRP